MSFSGDEAAIADAGVAAVVEKLLQLGIRHADPAVNPRGDNLWHLHSSRSCSTRASI